MKLGTNNYIMNMTKHTNPGSKVGWLEFNVPFQHKYGNIRDETQEASNMTMGWSG